MSKYSPFVRHNLHCFRCHKSLPLLRKQQAASKPIRKLVIVVNYELNKVYLYTRNDLQA